MITTSTYRSESIEQISVTAEGFTNRALLTRFRGSRTWSVRGSFGDQMQYGVECHDGLKTQFIRATALELAERFVCTGREFL